MTNRKRVLELLRSSRSAGLTTNRLQQQLGSDTPVEGKEALEALLADSEMRGEAIRSGAGRWVAIEYTDYHVGTVRMTARGFGVVRASEAGEEDIVVAPERLGSALDGDFVVVLRKSHRKKGQPAVEKFGEVVRVLRRRGPPPGGGGDAGPGAPGGGVV